MGAAFVLAQYGVQVTLFERESSLGGDTFGVRVFSWDGRPHTIDGGVSDFNQSTFLQFNKLLQTLEVETKLISRETGFMDENQRPLYFITDAGKMTFWEDLPGQDLLQAEVFRFRQESVEVLQQDEFGEFSIEQYLNFRKYSEAFWIYHLRPRALGCFSMHRERMEDFPIRSFVSFLEMHSIVGPSQPSRICLVNGIKEYCKKFQAWLIGQGAGLHLATTVRSIERTAQGVMVRFLERGTPSQGEFTQLVLAIKPDEVLNLLENPSEEEKRVFSQIPCARDRIVVHTDPRLLPRSRRAWGAYHLTVLQHSPSQVEPTITRWQNNLSVLDPRIPDIFMTMNPALEPDPHLVVQEKILTHPIGSFAAFQNQNNIAALQGKNLTWHCGSYLEVPFLHENAFGSGTKVANAILQGSSTRGDVER